MDRNLTAEVNQSASQEATKDSRVLVLSGVSQTGSTPQVLGNVEYKATLGDACIGGPSGGNTI